MKYFKMNRLCRYAKENFDNFLEIGLQPDVLQQTNKQTETSFSNLSAILISRYTEKWSSSKWVDKWASKYVSKECK